MYDQLKKLFWPFVATNTITIIAAFIIVKLQNSIAEPEKMIAIQSLAVLLTLITIPVVLKKYNDVKSKEEDTHSNKVAQWMLVRWSSISLVIFLNAIVYVLIGTTSQLICAAMALVFLLFFCRPE